MTRGWVPASARTREGVGDGFSSLSSWGQALRGHDEEMGPRIREDTGGGCGRLKGKGLPVAAGFSGDDASKAWGGEMSCCNYHVLFLKFLQSFPTRFDAKLG